MGAGSFFEMLIAAGLSNMGLMVLGAKPFVPNGDANVLFVPWQCLSANAEKLPCSIAAVGTITWLAIGVWRTVVP